MIFKLIFVLILSIQTVYGQKNLTVKGKLTLPEKESSSAPIVVYLWDEKGNLVKSNIVQNSGFQFSDLEPKTYHFEISSDCWTQKEEPFYLDQNKDLEIVLKSTTQDIEEISLNNEKKGNKIENSNITLDVANTALHTLPTATELLSKLPFVMMDANGEGLSFVGKGTPLLYIDNQKVDFTTLSSISVDDIKSVEIIRNPPVQYESSGKAVIKINLKKSRKDGTQLSISETAIFQKRFSNTLSANYQQKKNKSEWKINAAYNAMNHWESNGFEYSVPTKNIYSDYRITSITKRPQTIFGGSFYQQLNDGDYITISLNSNFRPDKGDNTTESIYSENGNLVSINTLNNQDRTRSTINSVFNYNKKWADWDANLFTGLQYNRESDLLDYTFYNDIDNSGYAFNQFRRQKYAGNVYSGRMDFEKKWNKKYELLLGACYTNAETNTNNITDFRNNTPNELYQYNFKESNIATYANIGWNPKSWNIKGGIRMETTSTEGIDALLNLTKIHLNYADWFPNAEINYQQNNDFSYTANYRKSIDRPNYSNLTSGGLYGSPYVEYVGNPNLLPTYTHTFSFSSQFKKWSINASYYISKNASGFTLVYDENRNISKFTTVNFEKELGANIGLDFPFQWKKWSSQNSLSFNYDKTKDALAIIKRSTPYVYFSTNNTFVLMKHLSFLLDGSYISSRIAGLYDINDMCLVNLGLTSKINNCDITFRFNDIFNQMTYIQKMTYNQLISKSSFYGNTPTISFSLKYNFGKLLKSNYKQNTVNENSGRL
ncbi:TonB-dependent receptor domain-containing protein [Chryseobacterium sp.]|uniref:TonB-dependent receptor domain-containing protein n=1 Tax=Chryseobacterium sp. TaxID=1871047 RepID=UPI00388D3F16